MVSFLAIMAFASLGSAGPDKIEVGHAKWDTLPRLEKADRVLPYNTLVDNVEQMLAADKCALKGQSDRKFNIDVPYAVVLDAEGKAQRVLVADMGCEPLETMVGEMVYGLSDLGDFKSADNRPARWYADEISLILD